MVLWAALIVVAAVISFVFFIAYYTHGGRTEESSRAKTSYAAKKTTRTKTSHTAQTTISVVELVFVFFLAVAGFFAFVAFSFIVSYILADEEQANTTVEPEVAQAQRCRTIQENESAADFWEYLKEYFTGTPRPRRVTYLTPGKDTCFYVRRTDRWLLLWFNPEADYTGIAARLSPEQPAGEELFKSWTLGNFLLEVERPNAYSVRFLPNRGQERSIPSAFNTWGMPDDVGVNVLFRPRK